jgi:hypothetical protein
MEKMKYDSIRVQDFELFARKIIFLKYSVGYDNIGRCWVYDIELWRRA